MTRAAAAALQQINPDKIRPNRDNPRLVFREAEMNQLLESIREVGVKVPLSVYGEGAHFVLIDGERRWRCAKKLNLPELPAIVLVKPSRLENLLMMFNIHNVRLDWDLMPMALKLDEIRVMLEKDGKATNAKALAAVTGVALATVRRALDVLDLPKKYQRMLLREAAKPREEQRVKVDLFIEVYKSLHAVEKHAASVFDQVSKPEYVDALVSKYLAGVVDNVVAYREVSKIARAEMAGVDKERAAPVIVRLIKEREYSITDAYAETVEAAYERRDLLTRVRAMVAKLKESVVVRQLDDETRSALSDLRVTITEIIGG